MRLMRAHAQHLLAVVVGVAALTGCRAPGDMRSSNPYERARAIVQRAEAGDTSAVHQIVGLLEDEDEGVRLYAIVALRKLCGRDYGYNYYDAAPKRAAAVARWREALQAGEVAVQTEDQPGEGGARG